MSLLITEPRVGIAVMRKNDLVAKMLQLQAEWPCMPCASRSLMAFCCAGSGECTLVERSTKEIVSRMPAVSGICAMCLSPCSRYVYQLSAEADCVHALSSGGELLYAAPAGVFPRTMQMDERGETLLVSGGAVDEAYVFTLPDLHCRRVIHTRHPCFGAGFWKGGLVLVCAAEGNDIQTMIYTLSPRGVKPAKLMELPGQPGGMCVCPDRRHMLLSTPDGLMKIDLASGSLLWNRTEWPLCMKLCCYKKLALISDTLDGKAWLIDHEEPWNHRAIGMGFGAQACFLP